MLIIRCPQGSPDWHAARAGVVTASMFSVARERLKTGKDKGGFTKTAKDYAFRLALERISWEPLDGGFETWQQRRGRDLEPEARALHAKRIGREIEQAGLVLTEDHRFGASADGLIEEDGGAEYKCFLAPEKLRALIVEGDTSDIHDQIQGCLWLTDRKWWHLCLYCPALAPAGKDLIIHEQKRDDDYITAMVDDLMAFERFVCECQAAIENADTWHKAA